MVPKAYFKIGLKVQILINLRGDFVGKKFLILLTIGQKSKNNAGKPHLGESRSLTQALMESVLSNGGTPHKGSRK